MKYQYIFLLVTSTWPPSPPPAATQPVMSEYQSPHSALPPIHFGVPFPSQLGSVFLDYWPHEPQLLHLCLFPCELKIFIILGNPSTISPIKINCFSIVNNYQSCNHSNLLIPQ